MLADMESTPVEVESSPAASDRRIPSDKSLAVLRREAWAKSRDSTWKDSQQGEEPQQATTEKTQGTAEKSSHVPNKITSWLIDCRSPLGSSLDEHTPPPSKGPLRNGCSFEDDLSLGADANHLNSTNKKLGSCLGLVADQKRSQFKEKGRSMNSTGSGKSSTVSSVSELLDLYEEDPEEILLNLGFGRDEPDLSSKVPSRFLNSASSANGIDVKVYLGAQMQRMEVENPNYALTSRFRQLEVLTNVANEFFQLFSQVSGQSVECINNKDKEVKTGSKEASPPPLKRKQSILNFAKQLKRTNAKPNLLAGTTESPGSSPPLKHTPLNGEQKNTNISVNKIPEPERNGGDTAHQTDAVNQKQLGRKRDNSSLATVTEETPGDGDDGLSEQSDVSKTKEKHPPESAPLLSTNHTTEDQVIKEEKEQVEEGGNLTSTPTKAPSSLAPPQLAQLRTENANSFDIEEILSIEDDVLLLRNSRNVDLLRTVSMQSDSSGFAEEPSTDYSNLKVQESCESCDSEMTVTSHPSQDMATPPAVDKPEFELPDCKKEEEESSPSTATAAKADDKSALWEEEVDGSTCPQLLQYTSHHLPTNKPIISEEEQVQTEDHADSKQNAEQESTQEVSVSVPTEEPEPTQLTTSNGEPSQNLTTSDAEPILELPTSEADRAQKLTQTSDTEVSSVSDNIEDDMEDVIFDRPFSTAPPSPVLCALNRARRNHLNRKRGCPRRSQTPSRPSRGRGITLQRSSSLPSSLSGPSRVVSSVRIQFGQGETSCSQPSYSIKNPEDVDKNNEEKPQNYFSTLVMNHSPSSLGSTSQTQPLEESPISPKAQHSLRSTLSLRSPSPPTDWSTESNNPQWCTQSVPDLTRGPLQNHQFQQGVPNQNQSELNSGSAMYPAAPLSVHSGYSSGPYHNPGMYPFMYPPQQYAHPMYPYGSLPNLNLNPSATLHSSMSSLHPPSSSSLPYHSNFSGLQHGSPATGSQNGHLQQETPNLYQQNFHPYVHQSLDPSSHAFSTPHLGFQGQNMNPLLQQPFASFSPMTPDLHLHRGHVPFGCIPGMSMGYYPVPGVPGPALGSGMSSVEMQLRKVLCEIKGTVQGLNQHRVDTPDLFGLRAEASSNQVLAEFQQRRRSLCLFRNQMMDLELSLMRQQALVYKQLSTADRLELEQLQSLRSAVRDELQTLEQQLEERMMEHTQLTPNEGFHRDAGLDSLSTTSVLRATEPVSDLLREQLLLQSELRLDNITPTPSHSSSETREGERVFRASINITPVIPSRLPEKENGEEEERRDEEAGRSEGSGQRGPSANITEENLQQLIKEIRDSVAKEVREEIYHNLMAAVLPRQSP